MADNISIKLLLDKAGFQTGIDKSAEAVDKLKGKVSGLKKPVGEVGSAFGGLTAALGPLKVALGALAGAFAVGKLISSAIEAEQAVNNVAIALKRSGEFSQTALKDVTDFASKLQDMTGLGDEAALEMFALAKSFGISAEEAKKVVAAANDLSAATGQDLMTATKQLSEAYNGQIGKLGKLNPALKDLTKAQLAAGEATKILGEAYAGTAAAQLQTFGGALNATKGRLGDLAESLGGIIVRNPLFVTALNAMGDAIKGVTQFFEDNGDAIRSGLNKGIELLLRGIKFLLPAIKFVIDTLRAWFEASMLVAGSILQIISVMAEFDVVADTIKVVGSGFLSLVRTVVDSAGVIAAAVEGLFDLVGIEPPTGLAQTFADISTKVDGLEQSLFAADIPKTLNDATTAVADFSLKGVDAFKKVSDGIKDATGTLDGFIDKAANGGTTVEISSAGNNPNAQGHVGAKDGPKKKTQEEKDAEAQAKRFEKLGYDALAAFTKGLSDGREGASKFLSAGASAVADAFVPGLGAAVGPIVDMLAQGPDAVREMVNGFADALPEVIDAIVEAIPVLVEVLAERAPDIIIALANGMPQVAVALAIALADPMLYVNVARALGQAAYEGVVYQFQQLGTNLNATMTAFQDSVHNAGKAFAEFFKTEGPKAIKEAFGKLWEEFRSIGKQIGVGLWEVLADAGTQFWRTIQSAANFITTAAQRFLDAITPGGGGGKWYNGGKDGKGNVTGIKGSPLATGGMVRGHGTKDSVPAVLAPGELVIDRTTGPRLNAFMDRMDGGASGVSDVLLAKIIDLLQRPMTVETKAELDGRTLADIILTLNRTNQRLA